MGGEKGRPKSVTKDLFEAQMNRLRTQWPHSYGKERKELFWMSFQLVADAVFTRAVNEILSNSRSAPMVSDIDAAINLAKHQDDQLRTN